MSRDFCYKCHRAMCSCLCSYFKPLKTNIHFVVLIHPMERQKIKNGTGRMTHFQLENSSLIYGVDFTRDKKVNELLNHYRCALLYPGVTSLNLTNINKGEKPRSDFPECIFILDATWPLAKKMLKLSPNLQDLPKVSFSSKIKSNFLIKQQPHEACLSTIESTKVVLDELTRLDIERKLDTSEFLKPFNEMIKFQLKCIADPDNNHHHHIRSSKVATKNMYKKAGGRKIFFDD